MRTAKTPGSHEATTPSGLGAAGVSSSPMSMGSPTLSTRSVLNVILLNKNEYCGSNVMKPARVLMVTHV